MTVCKFGNAEIEVENIIGNEGKEKLHFRHPLSGLWCESVDKVLEDMDKYYNTKKSEWVRLVENIKNDGSLNEKVSEQVKEKEYV